MGVADATVFFNFSGLKQAALGGGARDVIEPATGQVLCTVGIADVADVAAATAAAAAAQKRGWRCLRAKRLKCCRAAALFQQHGDELALYAARETVAFWPKASMKFVKPR